MPNADQLVQTGLAHHQAGRLDQANEAYQQALNENPEHPEALHLLGMLAHQVDNNELAFDLISLALHSTPNSPVFLCNLGSVLQAQGKLDEAVASFHKAIRINPGNAVFHYNLGHALQQQGKMHAAQGSYQQSIALAPDHLESHSNLGHTLQALGQLEQAIESFQHALNLAPELAEMHFNLGAAVNAQGKLGEAIKHYQRAIALFPNYAQAHCNLGAALLAKGQFDDAVASYQRAIALNPSLLEAHYNLGIALQAQDKFDAAIASYFRALEIQPSFVEAYCNLGNTLRAQGKLNDAIECYQAALAIKPDYANAYSNLLFLHSYHGTLAAADYLKLAREWEQACVTTQIRQAASNVTLARPPLNGRRLKLAYISGDFRKHALSYFMQQLLAQHDHSRVELYAYSNNRSRDEVTERLNALVDHWIPISGMSDEVVCQRMEADGIDVLVDLSGHSAHNRMGVFAHRAAPVQATYLYFASTGLSEMDYWIGDETLTPPAMDTHFNEQVWRLPRTWMAYKTIADAPEPNWQSASDGTIWLGCFNNLGKITPQTLSLWAKILQILPEGRLLLKNKDLADAGNQQRILSELAAHGIAPERIELQPGSEWADYMAQHDKLDIALDPIGAHGGGTSTCDALWMGVPVIHLLGEHVGARFAGSLLEAINHSEWIAHSETEYIETTISLAKNVTLRKQLRAQQRQVMQHSPLCDAQGLAHALEDAYVSMFERWQSSQPKPVL